MIRFPVDSAAVRTRMISNLPVSEDYRAKARRLREIASRHETAPSVREALAMAAEEYERLARTVEQGSRPT
jgi:outer membrane protein assembly factor BamD (BamD/ComL family)